MPNLGPTEIIVIAIVALLLFGGTRLAGLGKNAGRSIREFKEETRSIKDDEAKAKARAGEVEAPATTSATTTSAANRADKVVDAEVVEERRDA